MKRSFILNNIKPFSINSTYYGGGSAFVKTSAAREWTYNIFHRLSDQESEQKFKDLREAFDPKKHGFSFSMIAYYPRAQFYTKQGTVSSKTLDLSNCEKSLLDAMFLAKNAINPAPYGCQNLQLDDKYVTELRSSKRLTDDLEPRIEVEIELLDLTSPN